MRKYILATLLLIVAVAVGQEYQDGEKTSDIWQKDADAGGNDLNNVGTVSSTTINNTGNIVNDTNIINDGNFTNAGNATITGTVSCHELLVNSVDMRPQESVTFSYDSGTFTDTQFQADIDSLGKYLPYGTTVQFQFSNGTYTIDQTITIAGFYGGGEIQVEAVNKVAGPSTAQNVIFDMDSSGLFYIRQNTCSDVWLDSIHMQEDGANLALVVDNFSVRVYDCYINQSVGTGTSLRFQTCSNVALQDNYFTGGNYAIQSEVMSQVLSKNNDDTGTQPAYGLRAEEGGVIAKSGTQITGGTANESTATGGEIR